MKDVPYICFKNLNSWILFKGNIVNDQLHSSFELRDISENQQGVQRINQCQGIIPKNIIDVNVGSKAWNTEIF